MVYKLLISNGAESDTKDSYTFYEQQQQGLGDLFMDELEKNYRKLLRHPTHYSYVSEKKIIRALSLRKFPFQIIYQIESNEIHVLAIHHFRRRPTDF